MPNVIGKLAAQTHLPAWLMVILFGAAAASVAVAGIAVYRWRLRQEMHGEIRAIMREYMPLDSGDASELGSGLLGGGGFGGQYMSAAPEGSGSGLTELSPKARGGGPL